METENPRIVLVTIGIIGGVLLIQWFSKRKKLEQDLLNYGVEMQANVIKKGWAFRGLRDLHIHYEINGREVTKVISVDISHENIKSMPILIDPMNPKRVLYNMRKFDLKKVSEDSVTNFKERYEANKTDYDKGAEEGFEGKPMKEKESAEYIQGYEDGVEDLHYDEGFKDGCEGKPMKENPNAQYEEGYKDSIEDRREDDKE